MKLAANISMMFTELPFPDRIAAAAEAGFRWVECMFPYDCPADTLAQLAAQNRVQFVLINAPAGDWTAGDRGLAGDPSRVDEFRQSIDLAVQYAQAMSVKKVHVLAGCCPPGTDAARRQQHWATYCTNLAWLLDYTRHVDVTWLIEPINTRDVPGYLLNYQQDAASLVKELGSERLRIQMDLYHCQIMEGDILTRLKAALASGMLGHIQIAGVPERQEPNHSELNYQRVFALLKEMDYQDAVGCEYRPKGHTLDGLDWIVQFGLASLLETQGDRQ